MVRILNEHDFAEKILKEGFLSKKHGLEIFILAKYNRFVLGLDKKANKAKLIEFLKTQLSNYDVTEYYKIVNKSISNAYKDKSVLLEIRNIVVTQNELDYIGSLDIEYDCKRLLFTLMCLGKINYMAGFINNFIKTTNSFKDVKDFGNFDKTYKIIPTLTMLYQMGIIYIAQRGGLVLTFLENILPDNRVITIDYPTTIGYWYDKYNGDKKIINCEKCGRLIKRKSNRQVRCSDCCREREKEQIKIRVQNYRTKLNCNGSEKTQQT